jgi:hypothetical protein
VHAFIAQLIVLYEDLRIELYGITEMDIDKLDSTDKKYRVHYFLRRAIGTWCEFAEVIRLLDAQEDFGPIRRRFDALATRKWRKAVRFFRKYEHAMKAVRNDIGGHFGSKAARYAIENFTPGVTGKFEIVRDDLGRVGAHLYFAGEIVAVATFRTLPGGPDKQNSTAQFRNLLRIVRVGWRYGTLSASVIGSQYLWDRFG